MYENIFATLIMLCMLLFADGGYYLPRSTSSGSAKTLCKVVIYNYILCWLLFHYKKCCNCFNFSPCILWDFIVLGIVLSWWRIEHVLDEQVDFMSVSREAYLRKSRMRSTCWKLKSRARLSVSQVSRKKGQPARYP